MDLEKQKRRQSLKVLISEAIMVLAVVITVIILALVVSGYWVNSDFKVERQGMLQISSIPTGATVEIDGATAWMQRTNTSKVLSSGEHTIVLSREGYDTWSKTINIAEGLLYRIHYPRLFLQNRVKEKVMDTTSITMATVSPNRNFMLFANDTTEWQIVNIDNDNPEVKKINIAAFFSSVSVAEGAEIGIFTGKILAADWDRDSVHVLLKVDTGNGVEWVLLDTRNVKNSVNLTKEFGANFSDVKILDNSASNLLAVQNNNLHKIDVSGRAISAVMVENIIDFDHYNNELVFVAQGAPEKFYVGTMIVNDNKVEQLAELSTPDKIVVFRFYDERYIATLNQNTLTLYKKNDFEKLSEFTLNFVPEKMQVGHDGEFVVMSAGTTLAMLDMESHAVVEWKPEGSSFDWLDNDMIYTVTSGNLIVYDFDGLNRRELAGNVSEHFPVTITNNKWLYYFSDDTLMREWLIPR